MTFDTEQELEQINRYTRKTLTEDDVYRFTLTLCDNEIDRDLERFTPAALEELAALFVGKTGIFDHSCKSEQQSARLYHCWVETDKTRATSCGEAYTCLKARAYMVRTKENEGLIAEIEGGIKKEVSVGCAMGSLCCSVCGTDRRTAGCEHIKGRTYNGRLCHDVLSDATDAYEWSFVAVPAQREAGVTKAFSKEAPMTESILETVKSAKNELKLTKAQLTALQADIASLEQAGADAKAYREKLLSEIGRCVLIALPQIDKSLFVQGCGDMPIHALESLSQSLQKQTKSLLPKKQQLSAAEPKPTTDNHAFCI